MLVNIDNFLKCFSEKSGQRDRMSADRQCGLKRDFILKYGGNYNMLFVDECDAGEKGKNF